MRHITGPLARPDMRGFTFQTAGQIVFGRGSAEQAAGKIAPWGRRILLVRGGSVAWVNEFAARLRQDGFSLIEHCTSTEPDLEQVQALIDLGRAQQIEQVIAVGGGSVIDLGKAAAALIPGSLGILDHLEGVGPALPLDAAPLPFTALPTTAGTGAEVTRNAVIGVPSAGVKVSLRDARMFPKLALVDPALTDHAPRAVTLTSGMDALSQVIEPFVSCRATPMTDALCASVIKPGFAALARLSQGEDAESRDTMAHVSLTGGIALANAGLGAVHGFAGVIGGRTGAPHGLICARLLGPVLSANAHASADTRSETAKYQAISRAMAQALGLPQDRAFDTLGAWLTDQGMPTLSNWITDPGEIPAICTAAQGSSSMQANPHRFDTLLLEEILSTALH